MDARCGGRPTPTTGAFARHLCIAVVLACVPAAAPAQSSGTRPDAALHPAAQCAAFWTGRDDFARRSAFLDSDPADLALAAAFRAAAVRTGGTAAADIDAFIARQRPLMASLMEAYVLGRDRAQQGVHDRLIALCGEFAATAPEFDALR